MNKNTLEKMLRILRERDFSEKNISYMIEAIEKELKKKEEKKDVSDKQKDIRVREFIVILKENISNFDVPIVFNSFTIKKFKDFFYFIDQKGISFQEVIETLNKYIEDKKAGGRDLNEFMRRFMFYYSKLKQRDKNKGREAYSYFEEL